MDEPDASVLGKRARNNLEDNLLQANPDNTAEDADESDDDVGPMPIPAGPAGGPGTTKKKRKGVFLFCFPPEANTVMWLSFQCFHMSIFTLNICLMQINTTNLSCIET